MIRNILLVAALLGALASCDEMNMKIADLKPIPDAAYSKGVSAPFCGMAGNVLVVAGGANFPDKSLIEGGAKRVYADIWAMDLLSGEWSSLWSDFPGGGRIDTRRRKCPGRGFAKGL